MLAIPCFNEERRLEPRSVSALVRDRQLDVILVDDGSTDRTLAVLEALRDKADPHVSVLALPENRGKAEAVRCGLLAAIDRAAVVGYADADFATPPDELLRLASLALDSDADAVIGSRISFLGADIVRHPVRRYLGRVFAAAASVVLQRSVYDTQCGAKFFRVTDALRSALATPYISRWAFDVELLGRLWTADPGYSIVEAPLKAWADVRGSKIGPASMVRAGVELARIALELRRRSPRRLMASVGRARRGSWNE
ncbi:MAG TPA: glycosyltransferase [Kofleriaceae bacterium]